MTRSVSRFLLLAMIPMLALEISRPSTASGTTLANFTIGIKSVKYWDGQPAQSLDLMWSAHGWPLLLNGFACRASGKTQNAFGDTFEGRSYEAGLGVARLWSLGGFHPHLGVGVSRIWWRTHHVPGEDVDDYSYEAKGSRVWLAGGGFVPLGSRFHLGAAVRFSELRDMYQPLGGTHAGFTVGWGYTERR